MKSLVWVAGPPGTNYVVMKRAFEEGWGAVIAKTVSLDSSKARALQAGLEVHHTSVHCTPYPLVDWADWAGCVFGP